MAIVSVPSAGDPKRKRWAKQVWGVDPSGSNGWAFHGDMIDPGGVAELDAGVLILTVGETGPKSRPRPIAEVHTLRTGGQWELLFSADGMSWALALRDQVDAHLHTSPPPAGATPTNPLAGYSDQQLRDELERRIRLGIAAQPKPVNRTNRPPTPHSHPDHRL
jgi:hypothetical protein